MVVTEGEAVRDAVPVDVKEAVGVWETVALGVIEFVMVVVWVEVTVPVKKGVQVGVGEDEAVGVEVRVKVKVGVRSGELGVEVKVNV